MLKDFIARNKAAEALDIKIDGRRHWLTEGWPSTISTRILAKWQFPNDTAAQDALIGAVKVAIEAGKLTKRYRDPGEYEASYPPLNADEFVVWLKEQNQQPSEHITAWHEATTQRGLLSAFAEHVHNDNPINWDYWVNLSNITPIHAAQLAFHKDPDDEKALPSDLRKKIEKLERELRNKQPEWSLSQLVAYLGEDNAPLGMIEVVKKLRIDEAKNHCQDTQPLELLTDEQKQEYNSRAAWSWVDAIYILQGYKPAYQLSTEQVHSHFPGWVKYFTDSLLLGTIGKEIIQAGEKSFIDSPANWQAFWQRIHNKLEPKAEAVGVDAPGSQVETTKKQLSTKKALVDAVFAGFSNLRSNEISLVMLNDAAAKIVIRKTTISVIPAQLGLKAGSQGWKLLESAAVIGGDLSPVLKRSNSSTDLEKEKTKIKAAVSRLRDKLVKAMGLIDDPIVYQKNGGYKFTFKSMHHAEIHGGKVSKGADAMDYIDDSRQPDTDFWSDDESY